jgi:hypothetical protein
MKDLLSRLKPTLEKSGLFYPNPIKTDTEFTIILEEYNEKATFTKSHLSNKGEVLGFRAHHKLTSEPYGSEALISKKIGSPGIHIIFDEDIPVDYANDIKSAWNKAHEYIFNKIINEEILRCYDVYTNLLDTTKIGIRKFKEREKHKANLSAEER